jgi:parvulin-like peptidyl-prolyl isomerase
LEPLIERALPCNSAAVPCVSGAHRRDLRLDEHRSAERSFVAGCKRSYGPDVVATVNGQPIQRSEVEKYYRDNLGNNKEQPTKEQAEATRLGILHQLIDDEILQQAAKKMNLVASDEEVDAKLAEMKAPYTQEEFDKRLQAASMSLDDLRLNIRRNLTSDKVMNKEVTSRINITDADISNFYNANKAQFNFIEPKYNIADIVVTSQPTPMQQGANLQNSKAGNDAEARQKNRYDPQPAGKRRRLCHRGHELVGEYQRRQQRRQHGVYPGIKPA